jgi:hypothetical protein
MWQVSWRKKLLRNNPRVKFMPSIQIDTEQLLQAAAQLPPFEFEKFLSKLHTLRRQAEVPHLSLRETELLRQINQTLPRAIQKRYETLRRNRQEKRLSAAEEHEFMALSKQREQFDVDRLQSLAELARLREVPLPVLLRELGIQTPSPEYA